MDVPRRHSFALRGVDFVVAAVSNKVALIGVKGLFEGLDSEAELQVQQSAVVAERYAE